VEFRDSERKNTKSRAVSWHTIFRRKV